MEISSILTGLMAGLTYAATAYAKKVEQEFDWKKFAITLGVGAVTGLIIAFTGWGAQEAYSYAIALGAVPIIENIGKFLKRKVWDRFFAKK